MAGSGDEGGLSSPSMQQMRDRSGSLSLLETGAKQASGDMADADAASCELPSADSASVAAAPKEQAAEAGLAKQVNEVMSSELGIPTLLNRLKQSIASAKEFALFLKRRSVLEDDHASGLKKLCRLGSESARRPEHRQGSFAQSYEEMVHIHERMAENGSSFAASLHQMYEDLTELAANVERSRKAWKTNGMAAEHRVADLEQAMRKSKAKYDALAEEYDRARTGEARQSGKVLGAFKAHKSAAQHEEDLLKKVQAADQAYQGHVNALQTEKSQLLTSTRPEAVWALRELIMETDSGLGLQMQKFAAFNEKLLLGNGLIVSPFKGQPAANPAQPRSLRDAVAAIDNTRDLDHYLAAYHSKIQPYADVRYERNPLLVPQQPHSAAHQQAPLGMHPPQAQAQTSAPPPASFPQPSPTAGPRTSTGASYPPSQLPSQEARTVQQPHTRSYSHGNTLNQQQDSPRQMRNSVQPTSRFGNGAGAPQLGVLPFQASQPPGQKPSPQQLATPFQPPHERRESNARFAPATAPPRDATPPQAMASSSKPVYGVSLARLYERDGLAVPMVVYQCIQAVDLFGLGVEGIYRQSGSLNQINKLKAMFDSDSSNPALDFRNPENFFHDVNSVTGLLKQFFRDLPDPLLTSEHHNSFIVAAKEDDDNVRRDSLHAIINALPDPNYATLRALMLHLHRVTDNSHINRMNSHNLAVIFGPTLMGSDPSTAIADAGWQIKVVDTVLQNTYQIFDED
ncbi:hypothetical protein CDD81_7418 [Ophiocordyceps australis]|uniref:Rho-GAP domain-containing protein n=1 Tax=Ophiocordyceps australis TaxID=1399860 RepID=A0A2C5YFH2_9HYPO|nr:hypothetical protein CDD81_7418 [Ophiocordyceps australis]